MIIECIRKAARKHDVTIDED
ncbi:hypothetical protein [Spirosoma humi]